MHANGISGRNTSAYSRWDEFESAGYKHQAKEAAMHDPQYLTRTAGPIQRGQIIRCDRFSFVRSRFELLGRILCASMLIQLISGQVLVSQPWIQSPLDSLDRALARHPKQDTTRVKLLIRTAAAAQQVDPERGIRYAESGLRLAESLSYQQGKAACLLLIGKCCEQHSDYPKALEYYFRSLTVSEGYGFQSGIGAALGQIGIIYAKQRQIRRALEYYDRALRISEALGDSLGIASQQKNIGLAYRDQKEYQKALGCFSHAVEINRSLNNKDNLVALFGNIGNVYSDQQRYAEALESYDKSLDIARKYELRYREGQILSNIGYTYFTIAMDTLNHDGVGVVPASRTARRSYLQKSIATLQEAVGIGLEMKDSLGLMNRFQSLSEVYRELGDFRHAYENVVKYSVIKDSIFSVNNQRHIADLEQRRADDAHEKEMVILQQRGATIRNMFIGGAVVLVLAVFLIFLRIRHQRRMSELRAESAEMRARALQAENDSKEIELRRAHELEVAYNRLRETQTQLVQQEKMASLGQLTAGIAHEIKNPLNFINNFADVSAELARDFLVAQSELARRQIGNDLEVTLQKIAEHGKKAESIVRSMVLHARGGVGDKQTADINILLQDTVNLTFHGMRAQFPDFTVALETAYDPSIIPFGMYPQEISRAFLNILNNAFQAVHQYAAAQRRIAREYEAVVRIETRHTNDRVQINISDNGPGIPEEMQERVFEPFFTTKPTGKGTGLGLSISYDIVTKTHKGTLEVHSRPGHGCTFIVTLPVNA